MTRTPVPLLLLLAAFLLPAAPAQADPVITVEIEGIEGEILTNVRQQLSVHRYREEEMSEARLRRLHSRAPEEIRRALRPFGYYRPEISRELSRSEDGWTVRYVIDPGLRIHMSSVEIRVDGEGGEDRVFQQALERMELRESEPLNHQHYEQARSRLLEIASRRGYLEARFTERTLLVDPELGFAQARLVMDSGPRYFFGEVEIKQDILDDDFVRRYVPFETGEPFDADRLLGLQYGLGDSEYFSYVDIRPRRDLATEDRQIPIQVEASARAKHRYQVGLGYGTDTGPRVWARWENRRINNRGHRGVLNTEYSTVRRRADLRYIIPLEEPTRERVTGSLTASREDLGDIDSRLLQVGVGRTTMQGPYQRTTFVRLEQERSIFNRDEEDLSRLVVPGVMWSRTRADDAMLARRGRSGQFEIRGGHESMVFTDTSFLRAHLQLKQILPLGERNRIHLRGELGSVSAEDTGALPASQRFFTGGDRTVRGFSYQDIGPRDEDGRRVGGRYLMVGSVELDRRLTGQWYGAVFWDAGNAMNERGERLKQAFGIGGRWASPVGMVRLDLARPRDRDDGNYRIHLSVGPDL